MIVLQTLFTVYRGAKMSKDIKHFIIGLVIYISVLLIIFKGFFFNMYVPSNSMYPTFAQKSLLLGNKFAYILEEVQRFDIVAFHFPDDETKTYIKRIIGLPGEKLEIIDGIVVINDKELNEPFIKTVIKDNYGPIYIPKDCYFVLGDNRADSYDSRYWINTYIHKNQIIAKALLVYYPSIYKIQ